MLMCAAGEHERDQDGSASRDLRSALRLYTVGFAVLGFGVGFYAGSSQSPVVATLLPLLFGLVGAGGGLYLAQADLGRPETALRLRLLGRCLLLFVATAILGSAYGISLRTGRSMLSFVSPRLVQPERPVLTRIPDALPADLGVESVILRARLKALGASGEETLAILAGLWADAESTSAEMPSAPLRRLAALAATARNALAAAFMSGDQPEEPDENAHLLAAYLDAYSEDYAHWAGRIEGGEQLPAAFVTARLDGFLGQIDKLLYGYDGCAAWLAHHDGARQAVWDVQWNLIEERSRLGRFAALPYRQQLEAADRLLAVLYGGGKGGAPPNLPWELPKVGHLD
jgi:hypothetical protein